MQFSVYLSFAASASAALLALAAGAFMRRPLVRWTFVATMLLLAAETGCDAAAVAASSAGDAVIWKSWGFGCASFYPAAWLLFTLTYARGNAGRFVRQWRLFLVAAFLLPVGLAVVSRNDFVTVVQSPRNVGSWMLGLTAFGTALQLALLTAAVLGLTNLERTYRSAVGRARWRVKYLLLGLAVMFGVRAYTSTQALLFHGVDSQWVRFNAAGLLIGVILAVPAVLRSAMTETELYPSQAVLRNSLTVVIAGAYLFIVGVAAKLVALFGGGASFQLQALVVLVALVGLAVFLQSDHARLRARRFISRHFRRPMHDYRQVWTTVAEGTTSCLDQTDLCRTIVKLVASIFDSLSVSIWVVERRNEAVTFGASTFLSDAQGRQLPPLPKRELTALVERLSQHPEPIEIETTREDWADRLRAADREAFPGGKFQICVPLLCRGELLGLLFLGDRVGRVEFTADELDVLKCVADHAAASLRNAQLSQKLLQSKELEAFQTMAAFFVHDLKNAASTLSLMLQNLPAHFDDPRFREDALRGIGKTVTHVNHLIGRLGQLRHELSIKPEEFDFNQMVARAVAGCAAHTVAGIETDYGAVRRLRFDPDQMAKVVTNLVLNATEAVAKQGRIHVSTSESNGWAVLSVEDDGCGMAPEFIDHALFRPFQTTKKHGLGVGMFQSKMIVEAHGGRLAVQSEPGRGTTFRVYLPTEPIRP